VAIIDSDHHGPWGRRRSLPQVKVHQGFEGDDLISIFFEVAHLPLKLLEAYRIEILRGRGETMIDEDRHVELGGPRRRGEKKATPESQQKGEDSAKMQVSHKVPSSLSVLEFGAAL